MKFGNNITHWKDNWSFEAEKQLADRRFKTAPEPWAGNFGSQHQFIAKSSDRKLNPVHVEEPVIEEIVEKIEDEEFKDEFEDEWKFEESEIENEKKSVFGKFWNK